MKKGFLALVTILIITSLFLGSGCSSTATTPTQTTTKPPETTTAVTPESTTPVVTETPTSKYGGTLTLLLNPSPGNPGGLPWNLFANESMSPQFIIETLLRQDNKGNVYPWLAESYTLADDLMSITFTLRKDVKFHDGTDFNAEAAKWNLENTMNSFQKPATWASIDVIDNHTLRVNFTEWSNANLNGFADGTSSWMVSPTAYEKNGEEWAMNNPCGTGPFKFVSFQKDVSYKTVRNPDYWGKDEQGNQLPYLDAVEIKYVADIMTQKSAMQAGEGDALYTEPGKTAADLKALGFVTRNQINTTMCLVPDAGHADSPFTNQKVREAVEYALDREGIAKAFSYGFWEAPNQIPGSDTVAYNPGFTLGREYNLDKAKQLMDEAGYANGFKTTIVFITGLAPDSIPLAIQSDLKKIGIEAEIDTAINFPKWLEDGNNIVSSLWLEPIAELGGYNVGLSFSFGENRMSNKSWLASPEFTALFDEMMSTRTPEVDLMRACFDQITKEASCIPVTQGGIGWVMAPYVAKDGWLERSVAGWISPEKIWLDK